MIDIRRTATLLLLGIVILALSGAAEAAIASSGGGLASSITGAGMVQGFQSISAGHSAVASREAHVALAGVGAATQSQSGTQSAVDTVNLASVSVTGSASAFASITGDPLGLGTATADAVVMASSDQPAGGEEEVETIISSQVSLFADDGQTATGRAAASGRASAGGTMPNLALSSSASGPTSASGMVRGCDTGATLLAQAFVESDAWGYDDGTDGESDAWIWNYATMNGIGLGSASVSASGTAGATSAWHDGTSGSETSSVTGATSGSYSFRDSDAGGQVYGGSSIGAEYDDSGAVVGGYSYLGGSDDTFSGTATFSASGTARDGRSDDVTTFSGYSTGGVTGSLSQTAEGQTWGGAFVEADPWTEEETAWFPVGADGGSVTWVQASVDPTELSGINSEIGAYVDEADGNSAAFRSTANLRASGTSIASGTTDDTGIDAVYSTTAKGTTTVSTSASGISETGGESLIVSQAGAGDGSQGIDVEAATEFGPPFIGLDINANAATMSGLLTDGWSVSPLSTVTTQATGSAGATAANDDVDNSFGSTTDTVSSTSSASGTVSGSLRTMAVDNNAGSGSAIWGMSAAGRSVSGDIPANIDDFGVTDSSILTGAAVSNPGTGTSTASGKANGNAQSTASETGIDQGAGITDRFTVTSSDSGQLTADISAKDGYGNALAYVRSGNLAGQVSGSGTFVVYSEDPASFYNGIATEAQGAGNNPGSRVSGSASVMNGVSDDSGSYVRDAPTPADEFTITTNNHLTDPAKSEFSVRDANEAGASTIAFAFSRASYDPAALLGHNGYSDAFGGFQMNTSGTLAAPGTTAKATVKPVNIVVNATTTGGTATGAFVKIKSGDGLASLKTQVPASASAHELSILNYADSYGWVVPPQIVNPGQGSTEFTHLDTTSAINEASAINSWTASSWDPKPAPFLP